MPHLREPTTQTIPPRNRSATQLPAILSLLSSSCDCKPSPYRLMCFASLFFSASSISQTRSSIYACRKFLSDKLSKSFLTPHRHHVCRNATRGKCYEQPCQVHRQIRVRDHLRMLGAAGKGYACLSSFPPLKSMLTFPSNLDLEWKLTYVGSATS